MPTPLGSFERLAGLDRDALQTSFIANWWVAEMLAARMADLATAFALVDRPAAERLMQELRLWVARDLAAWNRAMPGAGKPLQTVEHRVLALLDEVADAMAQPRAAGH